MSAVLVYCKWTLNQDDDDDDDDNVCSTTHRLATLHNVTDRQTTDDRRNSVAIARPLVRSAKNANFQHSEHRWY